MKRRATGRDEMLKRNQQRKRKTAAAKPAAKQSTTKTAFSGKSLMNVPKVRPMNATKTAFSGKSLMDTPKVRPVLKAPPAVKSTPKPAASKPATKPAVKASTSKPKTSAQSNKDGTYGKPMPSNPAVNVTMKPRQRRPGTGRTGQAAALAARRRQNKPKNTNKPTMTEAQRRAARLRARRGR